MDNMVCSISRIIRERSLLPDKTIATVFAIQFNCRSRFAFTREFWFDRLFKILRIAQEIQTGDSCFDCQFFIASDSQAFKDNITTDTELRETIKLLFGAGCTRIYCDGDTLWFRYPKDQTDNHHLISFCIKFYQKIANFNEPLQDTIRDRFAVKELITEGIVCAIAVYASYYFFEQAIVNQQYYLDYQSMIAQGLRLSVWIACGLIVSVLIFMRGSSLGHRLLIKNYLILALSLPFASVGIVHDLNIQLDRSLPTIVDARVLDVYIKEGVHRGRKIYIHYMVIQPLQSHPFDNLPTHIRIEYQLYTQLKPSDLVRVELREGYLGHPWYGNLKRINP
jgi:hypothetical protein